jgi:hypothetical protein
MCVSAQEAVRRWRNARFFRTRHGSRTCPCSDGVCAREDNVWRRVTGGGLAGVILSIQRLDLARHEAQDDRQGHVHRQGVGHHRLISTRVRPAYLHHLRQVYSVLSCTMVLRVVPTEEREDREMEKALVEQRRKEKMKK